MKYMIACAIAITLASTHRLEAGLVIGSKVTSNSSYGPLGNLHLGQIFSTTTSNLLDPGVEFTATDKVAVILHQDFVPVSADLTSTTIQIAFDVSGGSAGLNVLSNTWQFEFDNLTVANGAKIVGLSLLSDQGVNVSSTSVTDNSISINVQGYSGSTPIGTDENRFVTYTIEFQNSVPEPSTFALTAIGAVGLLASQRRRLTRS